MNDVIFSEEGQGLAHVRPVPKLTGLLGMVVRLGIAKDKVQAQAFLLGTAVCAGVLAIGIFVFVVPEGAPPAEPPPIGAPPRGIPPR
ncbi:MAG TPA: hypothetical protein VGB97_01650 [Candidatus Paceibacterota bacterium]|jgi:hypothetical protein